MNFCLGCFGDTIDSVPEHHATVSLRCGEIRIDYMGSSIVMATLTSFTTKLEDTWNIGKVNSNLHGKSARKMQRKLVFHVREKLSKGFFPLVCVPPFTLLSLGK